MEVPEILDGDFIGSAFSLRRLKLSFEISAILGEVLNEIHNVKYSERFWGIILSQYVGITITQLNLFNNPSFSHPPSLEEINGLEPPDFKTKLKYNILKLAKKLRAFNSFSVTRQRLRTENNLSLGFPDKQVAEAELGKDIPLDNILFFTSGGNKSLRKKAYEIAERQTDVFYRNAIRHIPQLYIEYFDQIISGIPLVNPEKKVFHIHLLGQYNKFILALYLDHGAKLYGYQHGAFYGEVKGGGHNTESKWADVYRTWGWKISDNHQPWKAYRLANFAKEYAASSKEKKYDILMCYPELWGHIGTLYENRTAYLLKHLDGSKYTRFLARPRPMNRIFSQAKLLHFVKHDKRVVIDSGRGKMSEIIGGSRLVLQFFVPATNFLECIYTDHPTIGLLQNEEPTAIIEPYYEFFLQQGVLHYDFESLVKQLNNIDIETWWAEIMQHPMYQEFKNTFARKA